MNMRLLFLLFYISSWAQQAPKVDFITLNALVKPDFNTRSISGTCKYLFKVKNPVDSIVIDAVNMNFTNLTINNKKVLFKNTGKALVCYNGFQLGTNTIQFSYTATPKQAMYFVSLNNKNSTTVQNYQIWTQGQGKYTSHWLPSFDNVNEKLIFNINVIAPQAYKVVSNGQLKKVSRNTLKNKHIWHYRMNKPMSSYLVLLALGNYDFKTLWSNSKRRLALYYKPKDFEKFDYTYKYSKQIFDFLEDEIGVDYPWISYKQVPVEDFLYAGMENTTATLFSQDFVVDKIGFNDQNYINVNAHELAHHWFGNLVTATSGKHHWLQEGFATYYALLTEKHLFGDTHFYHELLNYANEIQKASKNDTIPIMNEKASTLSFYKKGAWALYFIDSSIGHANFRLAVKNYIKKYQFKNVSTDDFLDEVVKVSPGFNSSIFKKSWLESNTFAIETAINLLSKNKILNQLFELQKMKNLPLVEKKEYFLKLLKTNEEPIWSKEILYQLALIPNFDKQELIRAALQSNNIEIRQAVALTTKEIPIDLKKDYESMLLDDSYLTKEIVLLQLSKQFPEETNSYLEQTKQWLGNEDKSFRTLWLRVALTQKDITKINYAAYFSELVNYASLGYSASVRQNAIEALLKVNPTDERVLIALTNATYHHKWQLVRFAKNTIRAMIKKELFRNAFENIISKVSSEGQRFLITELKI